MTKWWEKRPPRPDRPHRIHPYRVEASLIGGRLIAGDVKEGKNSVLAGLGSFDVELLDGVEIFDRACGVGMVDFPEDILLLPFHVSSKKHKHMVEPSGDVDLSKSLLVLRGKTQVAGEVLSILVHPRLRPAIQSGSMRVAAVIYPDPRDLDPALPRHVEISSSDGVLAFDEAFIGVSYELILTADASSEMVASSFDFLAVLREARG